MSRSKRFGGVRSRAASCATTDQLPGARPSPARARDCAASARRAAMSEVSFPAVELGCSSGPSCGFAAPSLPAPHGCPDAAGAAAALGAPASIAGRQGSCSSSVPSAGAGAAAGGTPAARRMMASSMSSSLASPEATFSSRTHRWYAPSLGRLGTSALRISASSFRASPQRPRRASMQVTRKAGEAFSSCRWASTRGCSAARRGLQAGDAKTSGLAASVIIARAAPPTSVSAGGTTAPPAAPASTEPKTCRFLPAPRR
mmetsp:Transcript_46240/g.124704  ORF Transcript_46240/g.124704 Transcript_46240/m.124704 type:complete len:258 (+) Transcript_46240:151-924(+)